MSRILHLSDLHFGRDRPELERPLLEAVNELDPTLVVISGDFTQRARLGQFERARRFLGKISQPTLSVPGNHDTPLDNIFVRALRPWSRYKAAIDEDLEPTYSDDTMTVAGVNTVNRFSWQRGRISRRRVDRVCRVFEGAGKRSRVVVLHHPLQHGPHVEKRLMRGARDALKQMQNCGAQIVLSGHLHNTVVAPFRAAPGLLFVQAGTGLSSRLRGEPNTFNLLDLGRNSVDICAYGSKGGRFRPAEGASYVRGEGGWLKR
ncbi:metallophosphoesterase family protein [Histidinibacterium aquaticum]|uniref:Metallophosphoesterase n=1 Tax=Histidinibacterium aquaticum TaxID=2613962 RepID=A0A5J5GFB9_9RHOB|nr:metallophosphoesterase family protein [Histidinibacterium aquaticum]KAA9006811.1 metallophosphoesterase [Histidinibacterium aquaticum]